MFNFSFLNSVVLFGLLAGIIPVLIHLFVKHQPKIVYFSSLRFLKEIQKNQARIIKLREILLLIIRILIILFLILALSRPVLKTALSSAKWQTHAPTVAIIVIDNSFSMDYLDGDQTLLDKAKDIAIKITEMLNNKDKVMLLTFNNNYNEQNNYFSTRSEINKKIKKISITDNSQSIKSVLLNAEKKLTKIDVINKEIYFITDNQKYVWKDIQRDSGELKTNIFVIPIHQENQKANLSTISAWFVPKLLASKNRDEIRANIKNFSEKKAEAVIVSLVLNNITQAEKVISLNPFQSKQVIFEFQNKGEKIYFGDVKVKDEILPDDNNFYFNFSSQVIKSKIVVIYEYNPSFQFATALDLITENSWQKITPEEISDDIVTNNHLFIFYRLENFSEKLKFFAKKILKDGKSVFIIPGDELEGNDSLKKWLNSKDIKFSSLIAKGSQVSFINRLHPICAIFTEEMFQKARINKMWDIFAPGFSPLLSNDEDKPILLIKGRFLISAIDFEESWTNLIFQTAFPVLCYHIGGFLGTKESLLNNYTTGIPFPINFLGTQECHLPDGEVVPILGGAEKKSFTQTDQQGQYFLFRDDTLKKVFSYNTPREESDLTPVSKKDIQTLQKVIPNLHFLTSDNWKANILNSRYGYELWKILLWIILALCILEMALAYSGKYVNKYKK